MIEYVFKPIRTRKGKRVQSRLYSGRYSLGRGERAVTVGLHVTDRLSAVAKLRALVVEKERERAGIVAPRALRDAASAPLGELVEAYAVDLRARTKPAHAKESLARIQKAVTACGWGRLRDVSPSSWVVFRASLGRSAKTVKEYQTSVMAWLNWLVRMEMLAANPLARVGAVKTLGGEVRKSRAFTHSEFSALVASAPWHRRIVYLFLGYTGLRKAEARGLLWSSVDSERGLATVKGKGGKVRVVPLRPELVGALREFSETLHDADFRLPVNQDQARKLCVFPVWPSDDALHADMRRAGVERKTAAGVLHWHAFRKTFVTWAASSGVGQRSAQAVVGHSTPALTANVYTDVEALPLRAEVAKLPWLGGGQVSAAQDAQRRTNSGHFDRFRGLLGELITLAQTVVSEGKPAESGALSLAARHGFEPFAQDWEEIAAQFCKYLGLAGGIAGDAQIEAAKLAADVLGRAEGGAL